MVVVGYSGLFEDIPSLSSLFGGFGLRYYVRNVGVAGGANDDLFDMRCPVALLDLISVYIVRSRIPIRKKGRTVNSVMADIFF